VGDVRVRAEGVTGRERIAHGVAWGLMLCATMVAAADARDQPGAMATIVAFGDSLTAGFGVSSEDAYPPTLERRLREDGYAYRVVNAGVSGETTAGGLRRVDRVLKARPNLVILELGANDGLRGFSPEQTRENLARIIERLQAGGATVLLAGMRVPPNYGDEYARAFEAVFPELARRYHLPLIPFFLDGVATEPALNQTDGLHPTADGYRVIVERIWPRIRPLLTRP
jgi:acyl-CoA thioesterase-1